MLETLENREPFFPLAADPAALETRAGAEAGGGKKLHQGVSGIFPALHQGQSLCNSTTALGLRLGWVENRSGSRCTGKERDAETGLDNFGARYFASNMGRFMVPDWAAKPTTVPYANFGDPQSLNLYAYVGNRPVTRFDVNGHCDPDNHCSDDPIPLPGGGEIRPTPCYCDGPGGNDPSAPVPGQNGPLKPDAQITLRYPPADSTPGIEALFHAPGMSSYWNNAAGAGNFFGYATMGVLGGVPALGTALPAAASAVGYGLGYAQGVVAVGTSGAVLIGKYGSQTEGYLADAEELGVGAFNLGDKVYGALNYFGAGWNANMGFLDAVTSRGAPILLGTQPVAQTGGYAMELDYLFQSGYGALIPAW